MIESTCPHSIMNQIRASDAVDMRTCRGDNLARLLRRGVLGLFVAATAATPSAAGQAYPVRAITVIVPFAAGGPTDIVTRIVTGHLEKRLGQQIIVENVVGAGGTTAAIRATRAAPDGYTLLMGHMGTHGSALAAYPQLVYDPVKDFAPIGLVVRTPVLVVVRPGLPVHDLADLIRYSSSRAGTVSMAHAGFGSISHATCTLLNTIGAIQPTTKAFQGTGPALKALVAGRVDYMCDQIVGAAPRVKTGEVRALAISSARRSSILPNVPTAADAGVPDFEVSAWIALFAPKDTPPHIVQDLNAALGHALDDPEIRQALGSLGAEIPLAEERSPSSLTALVEREIARWRPLSRPAAASDGARVRQ
ncbi:tripartite tricarboxylate transporter substrate-binding protein [Rhodopseudomonas palustris]|uniref:tripartite tricarboxylate transporter substrate-binding protein n=1 Tax=Rhodopseudomonas palustris TaxID=1076 RepID=UPI002ACD83F7|nr:tripartite tricarboxylate transporter substrate-binding protein [Rhodopseudomonas palustris]WQG99775.1 tripartite tricarboxylate transporter substrate-binding protein [Rhodopseudomonas palustris]